MSFRTAFSLLAACFAACPLAQPLAAGAAGASAAEKCLYLPPAWADRVVFYDSFESGFDRPEINRLGAKLPPSDSTRPDGFAGRGCCLPLGPQHNAAMEIDSPALSIHRPLTLMCWFRLDAPMTESTGFQLLSLRGNGPYLTHFVAGKGPWCALKEPTFVCQVIAFPGIPQYNNPWGGRATFEPGVWHHVALTVANAAEIRVYRDGTLKETILPKGRPFRENEVHTAAFGSQGHPMTLDEVLVLDRALAPDELADYVTASRSLRERGFPVLAPRRSTQFATGPNLPSPEEH
jgi:hypothetical protein